MLVYHGGKECVGIVRETADLLDKDSDKLMQARKPVYYIHQFSCQYVHQECHILSQVNYHLDEILCILNTYTINKNSI